MRNKILLFLSSYIPLYILLIIKNILERITVEGRFVDILSKLSGASWFDSINDYALLILSTISIVSFVYLLASLKRSKGDKQYKVIEVEDKTGELFFSYISIYLLSCMTLSLNRIVDCFVFLFTMIIVGIIYVKNDMQYLNPIMNILGYKIYSCKLNSVFTNDNGIKTIVIVPNDTVVRKDRTIKGTIKNGFIVCGKN